MFEMSTNKNNVVYNQSQIYVSADQTENMTARRFTWTGRGAAGAFCNFSVISSRCFGGGLHTDAAGTKTIHILRKWRNFNWWNCRVTVPACAALVWLGGRMQPECAFLFDVVPGRRRSPRVWDTSPTCMGNLDSFALHRSRNPLQSISVRGFATRKAAHSESLYPLSHEFRTRVFRRRRCGWHSSGFLQTFLWVSQGSRFPAKMQARSAEGLHQKEKGRW